MRKEKAGTNPHLADYEDQEEYQLQPNVTGASYIFF